MPCATRGPSVFRSGTVTVSAGAGAVCAVVAATVTVLPPPESPQAASSPASAIATRLHLAARDSGVGRDIVITIARFDAFLFELGEQLGDRQAARRATRASASAMRRSFRCIQSRKPSG